MTDLDIDRVSGQYISALNEGIKTHFIENGGFEAMDKISQQMIPSIFSAINNCLCKPLKKHHLYQNIEFVLAGSTSEGVNIPNMERQSCGDVRFDFEMDILCVFRDIEVGRTIDSPAILVQQEGTSKGYFVLYLKDDEYRKKWHRFCITPTDPKRNREKYLNPLLLVEDLYQQVEYIFAQIPLLKNKFRLEFNPPAITMTMSPELANNVNDPKVTVSIDIVPAVELPQNCLPEEYPYWINMHGKPKWLSDDTLKQFRSAPLHLVGKCSPKGQSKVEWRLSFNKIEQSLLQEIRSQFPSAIMCYRILKLIRFWHLKNPDFLHSYHLKMIFLTACHALPVDCWTETNTATNVLALIDNLLHCLAVQDLPSYFIPHCNLIEGVHPDFVLQMSKQISKIRKDPKGNILDLKR